MRRRPILSLSEASIVTTQKRLQPSTALLYDFNNAKMSDCFDVLIIGGGLAGLSTALSLVRSLHTAVVFDSRAYRSRKANWLHTLPGWDGRDPEEYRAAARQNILSKYNTVQFATGVVIENVIRDADAEFPFTATDSKGRIWRGRKLVLAMGIQDVPLDVPGYNDCWAKGMYVSLFRSFQFFG